MAEKQKKEHICVRMVKYLEDKGITIGKWEAENKISNGYLRRSAKEGTNIGFDLVENFLDKFPDVDLVWLITGEALSINTEKKTENNTLDIKVDQPTISKEDRLISSLEKAVDALGSQNKELLTIVKSLTGKVPIANRGQ